MNNSANKRKNELTFSDYSEHYQQEDRLQSHRSNNHQNNHAGVGMKNIKKIMLPLIFMVLLALICLFSFKFMQKIKDNRQVMMNIILSEQKNHEEFQEQINSLVELKQQVAKNTQTNSGMQKDGTQLIQKLQSRLKEFEQKMDNLQKRLQKLGSKTLEKEDVAKLAIIQANQIKKQLILAENSLAKEHEKLSVSQDDKNFQIKSLFTIPKNIWIFSEEHPNYLRKKYIENIKYYANLAGFSVQLLNFESANLLLSKESLTDIKRSMTSIREFKESITKESLDKLQIKLILLNFLNQYGGIAMDGNMAISEDIKWIESILQNKFVQKYGKDVPPQIVGFYRSERYFSEVQQQNISDESNLTFKYPMMEYFFIAAGRTTTFLPEYINTIHTILQNMSKTVNFPLKREQDQRQFHDQILDFAYQNLLKQKQYRLNSLSQSNKLGAYESTKLGAYDYYGLNLINAYYGPLKMQMIYELHPSSLDTNQFSHRLYDQFAHTSMDDYITLYGPIKYLFRLPFEDKMNHFIEGSSKLMDTLIYQDSVIHKIFYPQKPKELFIKKNPFFSFTQPQVKLWETLPKIIWVYQTDSSSLFSTLCMSRLKQMAKDSQFEVRQVKSSNIIDHLQSHKIEQIKETIKDVNPSDQQIISNQLYKLAVLQKHGGVFLNSTTLALQNFNWILKISNMPTQFLYNCFDANPKILMMWDPLLSQPQSWQLTQLKSYKAVRSQWNQAILETFIAVEKDNELIKEWFNTIKQLATSSTSQRNEKFKEYGLQKYGVLSPPSRLSSDILRYILAKKQREIKQSNNISIQNSAEYYKLWTLNAFTSSYKISANFNYQHIQNKLNSHLFAYSQNYVQSIVGKIRYMLTFSNSQVAQMDKILKENIEYEKSPLFDPSSIFMKNLRTAPPKQITNDTKQIITDTTQSSSINSTQAIQIKASS